MSRRIRLTWVRDGKTTIEECLLISEEDPLFFIGSDKTIRDDSVLSRIMKEGKVLFEDDIGVFALPPEIILKIEEL